MVHDLCFWMLAAIVLAWIADISGFSVNETSSYQVVNGDDVKLSWNYQLLHDEKILSITLLFTKNGVTAPLAKKAANQSIEQFPMGKDNALYKRYTDDAVINIDDFSHVELTLKDVQVQTDDNVLYKVIYIFSKERNTGTSEVEKVLESTVSVVEIPVISRRKYKPVLHVIEGNDVRLRCKTNKGKPAPNVTWYNEDLTEVLATELNSASLSLTSLTRGDDSNYTCVASNLNGRYSDRYTVSVVVQYPPSINLALSSKRVGTFIGNKDYVHLKCVADGNPEPTYKWKSPSKVPLSSVESIYSLKEPKSTKEYNEFGEYICEASNGIGDPAEHSVTVYEIRKPQKVPMTVTHQDKRSATISLHVPVNPGNGSLKEVILSYRGGGIAKKSVLSSDSTFVKLENLTPFTKYEVNVTVKNEYWASDGQRALFWTKSDIPGPPVDVSLHAVSSTVMKVAWNEPVEKNGEINKYKVEFYRLLEFPNKTMLMNKTSETIHSKRTHNLSMPGLQQYSLYRVCVTASTIGFGRPSCVNNTTLAPMPGKPRNIKLMSIEKNEVQVSWFAPALSGKVPLLFYNIDINCTSKEDQKIIPLMYSGNIRDVTSAQSLSVISSLPENALNISTTPSPPQRETKVSSLPPYSVCTLRIREGAGKKPRWGLYELLGEDIVMEESIPGDVKNLVPKSWSHDQMLLSWQRPDRINGELKKFLVRFSDLNGQERVQELSHDLSNKTFFYTLSGLKQMTKYNVEVSVHTGKYESLNPVKITKTTAQKPTPIVQLARQNEESTSGPIIGGILTVIFILVLSAGVLLYLSRRKKSFNRSASSSSDVAFFEKQGNGQLVDGRISAPLKSTFIVNGYEKNAHCTFSPLNPVPITCLKDLVLKYHENKEKGFSDEFRSVKCEKVCSLEISSRSENKCKNRYANILAYDHSRVVLNTVEDLDGSDYVNANYIDGYNKKAKFIATQGPVVAAFNDFWRMIWEQDTSKIIMVTNLVEKSRIKCQKYWPECDQGELYGDIKVEMIDEIPLAEYVVRRFTITQMNGAVELSSRTVTQYQFLSWPDHGVPQYPTALLQFVKRVRALDDGDSGPIVCHCSAGVGRTGTYIALDAMLDQIENEKTVDLLGYVTHIRSQRQLMVQTEAQYTFIYDTLLEAVLCGDTEVNTADLFAKIKHLNSINPGSTKTYMDEEFLRLSLNIDDTSQYDSAVLPCNIPKNRYPNVLPFEETRVKLWPYADIEGSDYINASFIDGYQQREAYILTQSPLENTVEEFWRMLWEYEVFNIVMISSGTERSKHHCWPYWPLNNDSTLFGILNVQLAAEEDKGGFIRREFRVINSKNGDTRTISHFMYFNWPIEGSPETAPAIEMIGQVQKMQQKTGNSAIVIHCSDGSSRSGALAALMYCLERLKLEGLVDIFQTVRSMRTQRIGLVRTHEQYQFIYMAVSNFLDCFSNYANFK